MIQLAVIDLAGTLVRDAGAVEGAFADALDAVAVTPDERMLDVVRATMGQSKIDVFRALLGDEQRARTANDAFEAAYERRIAAGETSALPGAVETLHLLRDGGLKVAVTTGFSAATRESLLHALGWTSLVDASLSPSGARRGRPAPDLVLAAVLQLHVDDVRNVAVAGDTTNDLLSGYRAGASVVAGVLTGAHDRATLETAPHTHILDSIAELPGVLDAAQLPKPSREAAVAATG